MTVIDGSTLPDPLFSVADAGHDFAIRLKAYAPNGSALGYLPEPIDVKVSYPLSELPALQFKYRKGGPNAEFLLRHNGLEVATELYIPRTGKWIEPINGRFVVLDWEEDHVDPTNVISVTAPGYAWLLSKVAVHKRGQDDSLRVAEESALDAESDAKRAYDSAQSRMNSAVTRVRNRLKLNGSQYVMHFMPRKANGRFPKHGSVLFHTKGRRFYWYSSKTASWYRVSHEGDELSNAREAYDQSQDLKAQYERARGRAQEATKAAEEATKNNKRPMVRVTAGAVMDRLIAEGRSRTRGRLNGLTTHFNGSYSSASGGAPADKYETQLTRRKWSSRFDIEFSIGQSYLEVLNNLTEMGEVEWFFKGRGLYLYRPGDLGVRLGDRVALQLGIDMSEAPDRATRRGFANYLLVRGEGHTSFGMWNDQKVTQTGWGVWEESLSVAGVEGTSNMKKAALKEAREALKQIKVESTRSIDLGGPDDFRPMFDYLPGQYISAYGADGTMESLRIMGITLTFDHERGVSGNITLGDRFMQQAIDFRKSMARTVGGYEKTIGGGTVPQLPPNPGAPQYEDALLPAPVLAATTRAGVNRLNGQPSTILTLAWQSLETPVDAEPVSPEEEAAAEQEAPPEAY